MKKISILLMKKKGKMEYGERCDDVKYIYHYHLPPVSEGLEERERRDSSGQSGPGGQSQ